MKVLVAGASGFMGTNIYNYLDNTGEFDLHGICNTSQDKNKFLKLDLTKYSDVKLAFDYIQPDIVIQAAASTSGVKDIIERPYIHVTDNVVMNSFILRECFNHKVKHFIFLSCGVMYQPGDTPKKESDFNESDEIFHSYFGVGWMKVYIEKQMEFFSRLGITKHTAIRHSNTYGPHDKYDYDHSHMFGATIRKVMDAVDKIEVWGNGEETARDLVYVDDISKLIHNIINKQDTPFELINAGAGRAYSVKEIVEKIVYYSGKNIKIEYNPNKPVIPTKLAFDSTLAKKKFDWEVETDIDSGIVKTIHWYKQNYRIQS